MLRKQHIYLSESDDNNNIILMLKKLLQRDEYKISIDFTKFDSIPVQSKHDIKIANKNKVIQV
jgi:HKD family nuclease